MTDTTINETPAAAAPAPTGSAVAGGSTAVAASTDSTAASVAGAGEGQSEAGKVGEAAAGDKPAEAKPDVAAGAPEQYGAFELPDGWALDGDRLAAVHEYAKAKNWSQEAAQENLSKYAEFREAEREAERGALRLASVEEFGGEFDVIAEASQRGIALLEKIRPGAAERLADTNLGNHPDFLFAMMQLSRAVKEDGLPGFSQPASAASAQSLEQRMYPSMRR